MPVLRQALFCTRQLGKDREIHSLILTVAATLPIRFPNRIANDEALRVAEATAFTAPDTLPTKAARVEDVRLWDVDTFEFDDFEVRH